MNSRADFAVIAASLKNRNTLALSFSLPLAAVWFVPFGRRLMDCT